MLRAVFGLGLSDAKEVTLIGSDTADSLKEHEEALAAELRKQK
jgi:hypothetical protein